jgi:hypothetical protein
MVAWFLWPSRLDLCPSRLLNGTYLTAEPPISPSNTFRTCEASYVCLSFLALRNCCSQRLENLSVSGRLVNCHVYVVYLLCGIPEHQRLKGTCNVFRCCSPPACIQGGSRALEEIPLHQSSLQGSSSSSALMYLYLTIFATTHAIRNQAQRCFYLAHSDKCRP